MHYSFKIRDEIHVFDGDDLRHKGVITSQRKYDLEITFFDIKKQDSFVRYRTKEELLNLIKHTYSSWRWKHIPFKDEEYDALFI